MPVAFVRLSRCNLACVWCDTAYTWRWEGETRPHRDGTAYDRQANQITLDEADVAQRILALGQNRLVITGGEPLLQGVALARMLALLPDTSVEIETNGTVAPPPGVAEMATSPRCAATMAATIAMPSPAPPPVPLPSRVRPASTR